MTLSRTLIKESRFSRFSIFSQLSIDSLLKSCITSVSGMLELTDHGEVLTGKAYFNLRISLSRNFSVAQALPTQELRSNRGSAFSACRLTAGSRCGAKRLTATTRDCTGGGFEFLRISLSRNTLVFTHLSRGIGGISQKEFVNKFQG